MARASTSVQCDTVASYMDGVHVKIAEAYKPPKKIGLPAAYNNRFPDVSKLSYDFSLEKSVLEKMAEWRKVRQANIKARHIRLEEKRKKEKEEVSVSSHEVIKQLPIKAASVSETAILTPQPLSPPANDVQNHVKTNGLDYADFDNDTSSPFDNMELKTINDMEELAQVLQPTSQWIPPTKLQEMINELSLSDQSPVDEEKADDSKICGEESIETQVETNSEPRSVSTIVEELQKELEQPFMANWKPWPDLESPDAEVINSIKQDEQVTLGLNHIKVVNPLLDLTEENRQLARHLNDMGFPLLRAARAIRDLGGQDNKKIVEYLLAVQSLEEDGISGDDAEKALALTQYDQDKAKMYYENLCTLRDLGFSEDQASIALLKCNIDRDRALDLLIA